MFFTSVHPVEYQDNSGMMPETLLTDNTTGC